MGGQVHRFGDSVGCYIGTGETVYLSARDARAFGLALLKVATSIDKESFVDSPSLTQRFDFEPAPRNAVYSLAYWVPEERFWQFAGEGRLQWVRDRKKTLRESMPGYRFRIRAIKESNNGD
jgi:hypothetical protein